MTPDCRPATLRSHPEWADPFGLAVCEADGPSIRTAALTVTEALQAGSTDHVTAVLTHTYFLPEKVF